MPSLSAAFELVVAVNDGLTTANSVRWSDTHCRAPSVTDRTVTPSGCHWPVVVLWYRHVAPSVPRWYPSALISVALRARAYSFTCGAGGTQGGLPPQATHGQVLLGGVRARGGGGASAGHRDRGRAGEHRPCGCGTAGAGALQYRPRAVRPQRWGGADAAGHRD